MGGLIFKDYITISNDWTGDTGSTEYKGFLWRKKFMGSNVRGFIKDVDRTRVMHGGNGPRIVMNDDYIKLT